MMARRQNLATAGTKIDSIPVTLGYQIIRHFSAGLYTSPNKALEELIANSYDAGANHVHVILPASFDLEGATMWVVDNGVSMDVAGFGELWRIGESSKRESPQSDRPQIGKFGIGKLATYVLAKELTHLCRHGGKYRAITMDFSVLEESPEDDTISLDVRQLSAAEAKEVLAPILDKTDPIRLFGKGASPKWTIAVMRNFRPMAFKLRRGRLKWVLRTALPLNPEFNLHFDGERLESPKVERDRIETWTVGSNDETAEKLGFESSEDDGPQVIVPGLGPTRGTSELYHDPLPGGKAEDWGRSHGFFVIVRGRLVNLHDELFGLKQLSHGAFSRFRMVVEADGLDEHLRATRESVDEEAEGVRNFRLYLHAAFNVARAEYDEWLVSQRAEESVPGRVSRAPRSLSREPLIRAIRKALDDPKMTLLLTHIPRDLGDAQKQSLLDSLESHAAAEDFFTDVRVEPLGMEQGLAVFDATTRQVRVNMNHPFFANYSEHYKSTEPFELLAVTEILTESYLLDEGLSAEQAQRILRERDRFLRELVFSTQLAAPLVAQLLDDNRSHSKGLERAVAEGLRALGFEVSPIGGKGRPDGTALARMGVRHESLGQDESYSLTYDAKSSGKDRISAHTVGAATIRQHCQDFKAKYALVVAPGYEGEDDQGSNAAKQAKQEGITLIALDDFILLILVAATRPLGFQRLRDEFFEKCRTPLDSQKWVQSLCDETPEDSPVEQILEAVWEMQADSPDPPTSQGVRERIAASHEHLKGITRKQIEEWMWSVRRIVGGFVTVDGNRLNMDAPPSAIVERIRGNVSKLPQMYLERTKATGKLVGGSRSGPRSE